MSAHTFRHARSIRVVTATVVASLYAAGHLAGQTAATDWPSYNRTPTSERYAPLDQINKDNVKNPQRTRFLQATLAGDAAGPGIGKDLVYRDPWGNPYKYLSPVQRGDQKIDYEVTSLGTDGEVGGEGVNADITNWNLDKE